MTAIIYGPGGSVPLPGASQSVGFRTGKIIAFNQDDLTNIINIGSTWITNVPLLGVSDFSTLVPGATVGLKVIRPEDGGSVSYAIEGRYVTPGTDGALAAINALNNRLFSESASGVVDITTSTSFHTGDGPVLSGVRIGPSGRALLIVGCNIVHGSEDEELSGGEMTVGISGATTRAPSSDWIYRQTAALFSSDASVATTFSARAAMTSTVKGLNPGLHTFTAYYRAGDGGTSVQFEDGIISVLAL